MVKPTESALDAEVARAIDNIQLSERLRRLRDRYFAEAPVACTDRLRLAMESWNETRGQDIELRRAKILQKVADNIPIVIHEGELTAGNITTAFRGAHPAIEYDAEYLKQPGVVQEKVDGHEVTFGSPEIRGDVPDNVLDICQQAANFFRGETPAELMREVARDVWGTWYEDIMELKANTPRYEDLPYLMGVPVWEKLLGNGGGLGVIIREIETRLRRVGEMQEKPDLDKVHFWQAVIIACQAAIKLSRRYARLAREMALKEKNDNRRQELEKIAGMCDWVPEKPARTFHEALQVIRMVHVVMALEGIRGGPLGFGRLDQCLYPFFKRDMAAGRLTLESAAELIGEFIGAIARAEVIASITDKEFAQATNIAHISFEEVLGAFQKQYRFVVGRLMYLNLLLHQAEVARWRYPFASALSDGCVENGRSHLVGGCGEYPACMIKDRGLVDVGDSLTAIKKLVFEEKRITMAELIDALDANFEGKRGEEIRRVCLDAPKFGNDIDEADYMVRDVGKFSAQQIRAQENPYGWKYGVNRNGLAWHYAGGKGVGALPNGRKKGEPLCDGSISPMRGMDTKGPTAVANSVVKADFTEAAVAVLNQKFPQSFASNRDSLEKVALFTETLLGNGATHVQYNFIDKQVLLDAQKHPEQYKDLIVRVAGYSAYFVNLTREVQDDIIGRTEQSI